MKGRFSEQQMADALREAEEGVSIREICRKYGISNSTFYKWKMKHNCKNGLDVRHLQKLEDENRRLKALVADLTLRNQALKQVASKKKW
jgi:putative transposase